MTNGVAFSLSDSLVHAIAHMVDDYASPRQPSHADLADWMHRSGISNGDPHNDPGTRIGKERRVRQVLMWVVENKVGVGPQAVAELIGMLRGLGGFRSDSPNFCGKDAIDSLIAAFDGEPVELTADGVLRARSLEGLASRELVAVLQTYVDRARRGLADSVLVLGTDKDLIEAAAAHVLTELYGSYSEQADFPTLLGQAFVALGLPAQRSKPEIGGLVGARTALTTAIYDLGCSIGRLRNKAGGGHGRPFLPELSAAEVRAATEATGVVAGLLLDTFQDRSQ